MIEYDSRKLKTLVESQKFDKFILFMIVFNALILGMITSDNMLNFFGNWLYLLDFLCLGVFIAEMCMKIYVHKNKFFKSKWNVFDLSIVILTIAPASSALIIFRTFRLLKYLALNDRLKLIIDGFILAVENLLPLAVLLLGFFYVFAILGVNLYGEEFVQFSNLQASFLSLFQVFTLSNWMEDLATPIMLLNDNAWFYFIGFLIVSWLVLLSYVISLIQKVIFSKKVTENHKNIKAIETKLKSLEKIMKNIEKVK